MPKTLLVVDDSPTIREAARLALAGEDWTVVEAGTAGEALEFLSATSPAAVLCDADLGGTGVTLCRKIRGTPGGRDLPLLLMGAAATPEAAEEAGATATLGKPFGSAELAGALQAAVDAQGFSLDLDSLELATETPLTLDELEIPFSPSPGAGTGEAEELEIIDLSDDEDFEELELIEDLEPLEPLATVAAASDVPAEAPFRESPLEPAEAFAFDADDLFASPGPSPASVEEEAPADSIDLDALFAPASSEPAAAQAEDDLLEAPAPHETLSLPEQEPTEFRRADAPPPLTAAIPLGPPVPLPSWDAPLTSQEPPADEAVREALLEALSRENLTPIVERVVERVVWEVVPRLAERLIREAIERLQAEPPAG